ncbi:AraC family transcriptional regulator [Hymenobacter busanensis]|uniref:AraC family transcriptional regulator n=1 Tax=Hymenobacter busanensis TaxID=2607656 RepID=A0A7L4ZZ95_9BACT|nr:helix-turn-helix domain-containing protein [Hymenobacter busanensis]KAA9331414.1 AraC family transcriptional regulator [Hymenobacter busanensis]QHJ08568.1 helix-turn-helix domain-containing protein [Hymenobacter busanensis]
MGPPFCQFYHPCAALQPFVSNYMLMHVQFDAQVPLAVNPFPTNPEQCLYFYARDVIEVFNFAQQKERASAQSVIVGPQVARVNLRMGHNQLTIKVGFRPGGLFRLFGLPMWELLDQTVDSHDLTGREVNDVNERLREVDDYARMIALVEQYLLRKVAALKTEAHAVDHVARLMLQPHEQPRSVDWLAAQACLSTRQFERKFLERVGMSPKLFARVARFARAYRLKDQQPALDWQDVVYQCGYYDQMHLIKDFKLFAAVTPSVLVKEEARSPLRLFPGSPF